MLITMIADLIRDEQRRRAFVLDPVAATAEARLTDEQQSALASRDPEVIARLLVKEISVEALPKWASPNLRISPPVEPATGTPGERIANLTIRGEWFAAAHRMEAQIEGGNLEEPVRVCVHNVTNVMMPDSVLTGSVFLPEHAQPGSYTVRVTRTIEDPPCSDTLPDAFTIVAR